MPATATQRAQVAPTFQHLPVRDLSGGLDLRRSPSLMAPNRARTLRNWSLQEQGALVTYPGWAAFSTSSLGANRLQGGQRVYLPSSSFTLAAYQGSVYKPSDGGVWGAAVLAGLSSTNGCYFPFDRNFVAVLDGVHVPKKSTDGSTWTQLGITAPTVAPTPTAVSGGSLVTAHQYEFSYSYKRAVTPVHESNEGPTATVTPSGGNLTASVVCTCSSETQVDTIVLYARDVTAGEATRNFVASTANTGSTVTFTVTADTWTTAANPTAPTTNNVSPIVGFGVAWKNRWWAVDATQSNRIWFSQIFDPQSWPLLFSLDVPFERGDAITALKPQGNTLVVCGNSGMFLIVGQTSLDFEVRPALGVQAGALGPRAVETIESGVVHADAGGIYLYDGAVDQLLSYDIDPGWADGVKNGVVADVTGIACVYHIPRKELRVSVPRLYPFGTAGEWVLDLNRTRIAQEPAWTSTDRDVGGYISWNGNESLVGSRGRLFSWNRTSGVLNEENTGTSANGANMVADYTGPTMTTGLHSMRIVDHHGEYQPATGALSAEVLTDGVTQGAQTIAISGTVTLYGTTKYGSAKYGGGAQRKFYARNLPLGAEGRSITVKYNYQGTSIFRLYSYALGIVPEMSVRDF